MAEIEKQIDLIVNEIYEESEDVKQNNAEIYKLAEELDQVKWRSDAYYNLEQEIDYWKCRNGMIQHSITVGVEQGYLGVRVKIIQNLLDCEVDMKTISENVDLPEEEIHWIIRKYDIKCKTKTGISM